jgi:hypothetical protein
MVLIGTKRSPGVRLKYCQPEATKQTDPMGGDKDPALLSRRESGVPTKDPDPRPAQQHLSLLP